MAHPRFSISDIIESHSSFTLYEYEGMTRYPKFHGFGVEILFAMRLKFDAAWNLVTVIVRAEWRIHIKNFCWKNFNIHFQIYFIEWPQISYLRYFGYNNGFPLEQSAPKLSLPWLHLISELRWWGHPILHQF